jgi:hypothetical protein
MSKGSVLSFHLSQSLDEQPLIFAIKEYLLTLSKDHSYFTDSTDKLVNLKYSKASKGSKPGCGIQINSNAFIRFIFIPLFDKLE